MPHRLLRLLGELGAEVTAEELADVLWLAERLPAEARSLPLARALGLDDASLAGAAGAGTGPSPHASAPSPQVPRALGDADGAGDGDGPDADARDPQDPHGGKDPADADAGEAGGRAALYSLPGPRARAGDAGNPAGEQDPPAPEPPEPSAEPSAEGTAPRGRGAARALPVRIPHPRALASPLAAARALRPLKRASADPAAEELDEEETAARTADSRVPDVVTRPVRSRWLDLNLVIDDGVSMLLWQQLCAELGALTVRLGAFRQIRLFGLRLRPGTPPALTTRPFDPSAAPVRPDVVTDPTGRSMTLVVSDGAGPGWRTGGMRAVLSRWALHGPTAVVHALPPRMWRGSGLPVVTRRVRLPGPGAANATWRVHRPDALAGLPGEEPGRRLADGVPVPVLEPSGPALADWARLTASGGAGALSLWDTEAAERRPVRGRRPARSAAADDTADDAGDPGRADAEVRHFRRTVSPDAYRLAAHLAAVSPLTVPVMRLVARSLARPVTTAHLAEVFLSGLLRPAEAASSAPRGRHVPPQQRVFAFAPATRDVLLDVVPTAEVIRSTRLVSEHIAHLAGRSPDFPAWLSRPDGTDELPSTGSAFAWLSPALQQRLGLAGLSARTYAARSGQRAWEPEPDLPEETGPGAANPYTDVFESDDGEPGLFDDGLPVRRSEPIGPFTLLGTWQSRTGESVHSGVDGRRAALIRTARSIHSTAYPFVHTETMATLRFDHPCLPALLDGNLSRAWPWVAVSGAMSPNGRPAPELREALRYARLPAAAVLVLGQRLASALDHAHRAGVVHGRLMPRHVLLTEDGPLITGWHRAVLDGGPGTPTAADDVRRLAQLLCQTHTGLWVTEPLADVEDLPQLAAVLGPFVTDAAPVMSADALLAALRDGTARGAFDLPPREWLPHRAFAWVEGTHVYRPGGHSRVVQPVQWPEPPGPQVPFTPEVPHEDEDPSITAERWAPHREPPRTKWFTLPGGTAKPPSWFARRLRRGGHSGDGALLRPRPSYGRELPVGSLIAVFGAVPGSGCSSVAVQLASALAASIPASRRPPVLMLPFAPATGVVGYRLLGNSTVPPEEFRALLNGPRPANRAFIDLNPPSSTYTSQPEAPTSDGTGYAWLSLRDSTGADFVHRRGPVDTPPVPERLHRSVIGGLGSIGDVVLDCAESFGPGERPPEVALGAVDHLVVATGTSPAHVAATADRLEWMAGRGRSGAVTRAVVVVSDLEGADGAVGAEHAGSAEGAEGAEGRFAAAERRLAPLVRAVVRVPFDQGLHERGLIDFSLLASATRGAFAVAARRLLDEPRPGAR
ncbi:MULTISPECIES: SAV_2336 N-terminal domain-related protein [unclassified Streptomyces]|uniref:SAV_2336 N-terminal domain-related protein n=1 Tax=unclassified Streptomyces TaxID=2593676 RepID=UPI0022B68465|nr:MULTISPECIES: SAV_2336 N-terminal domain-related protein [unclassified Streptomyces]MCZ7413683.1 SAV_2336 N-terminal domain-related protein [Streptomyces sp. WMMC897]MCZ7430679.1 SAV_2336 N-terminal domain-related protein [Streptomyces sp. WMMC1477]